MLTWRQDASIIKTRTLLWGQRGRKPRAAGRLRARGFRRRREGALASGGQRTRIQSPPGGGYRLRLGSTVRDDFPLT